MKNPIKILSLTVFTVLLTQIGEAQIQLNNNDNYTSLKYNEGFIGGMNNEVATYKKFTGKIDVVVKNKSDFLNAVNSNKQYYTIYVDDSAVIDLSDQKTLFIKTGVNIVSGRGINKSRGALIKTDKEGTFPLFECGSSVRFYGLRIQGNDTNIYGAEKYTGENADAVNKYGVPISQGIRTSSKGLVVENCEIYGWTHSGIMVNGKNGTATVSYSYIHHNRRHGLGYGITVDGGIADIQANLFDYNRHDIASTGVENSSYTAKNNVFLANGTSHSVDMHGGWDRKDNTSLAGKKIDVENNIFVLPENRPAFVVRGVPSERAIFKDNRIFIQKPGMNIKWLRQLKARLVDQDQEISRFVIQKHAKGNMEVKSNLVQ